MKFYISLLAVVLSAATLSAQENKLVVDTRNIRGVVPSTLFGVFFEDINMGADGGIYAELIKNRSFEFSKPMMGWNAAMSPFREGAVRVINRTDKQTANPRYLQVSPDANGITLTNEGE